MQSERPPPRFPSWLLQYLCGSAQEIAVKATAHVVTPKVAALIFAILAQYPFDWIGSSQKAIGEWTTTVKKAPHP